MQRAKRAKSEIRLRAKRGDKLKAKQGAKWAKLHCRQKKSPCFERVSAVPSRRKRCRQS